ncbi:NAD(P)-dependent oxidoreductase [Achromobacter insuavis]|uniref:NAD-dependent epimerase/dehydratase n=1 Tax=Achromobacter insuavis AXX-A TaxID=1003200 RepID=F7T0A1_9BURK|nr:NAD(P)H-binding protein [Achromobacter insuavis]EGP46190.1 NAD-dependent epimerase/dehydratase [Achromobacter insuavis AXX-A]
MKIAVIAAAGRAGRTAVAELLRRGHEVTAIARDLSKLPQDWPAEVTRVEDDLTDVDRLARAIQNVDAVISAVGAPHTATTIEETDALVRHSAQVIEAVRKAQVGRLIVVGGCGSLWISPGVKVVDSDKWPAQFVPVAQSHMKLLAALRSCGLNWTYVSPPMLIDLGERTGKYRTGLDDLVVDEAGKSWVSFEDYAIALVDELEHPRHERERFSVGY